MGAVRRERLEREFDLDLLVHGPQRRVSPVKPPERRLDRGAISAFRHADEVEEVEEPYIKASIIVRRSTWAPSWS